jgi:hypothetical protein
MPQRLGNFPFWRGSERFFDAIEAIYLQASPRGLDIFAGAMSEGVESAETNDRNRAKSKDRKRTRGELEKTSSASANHRISPPLPVPFSILY